MSIAEFYMDNGLNPCDPHHMDKFLGRFQYEEEERRATAKAYILNKSELDHMAETRGWTILDTSSSEAPMASYSKDEDGTRLNFWLTTGTVGSYLDHPRQGKTQLFRREITMAEASEIFNNPRQHTGAGYHTKEQQKQKNKNLPKKREQQHKHQKKETARFCTSCNRAKSNSDFSKNQRRKGSSAKCKTCVG